MTEQESEHISGFVHSVHQTASQAEVLLKELPQSSSKLSEGLAELHVYAQSLKFDRIAEVIKAMLDLLSLHSQNEGWAGELLSRGVSVLGDITAQLPEEESQLAKYYLQACDEFFYETSKGEDEAERLKQEVESAVEGALREPELSPPQKDETEEVAPEIVKMLQLVADINAHLASLPDNLLELESVLASAQKYAHSHSFLRTTEILEAMCRLTRHYPAIERYAGALLSRGWGLLQDIMRQLPEEDSKYAGYFLGACNEVLEEVEGEGELTTVEEEVEEVMERVFAEERGKEEAEPTAEQQDVALLWTTLNEVKAYLDNLPDSSSELGEALAQTRTHTSSLGYQHLGEVLDSMFDLVVYISRDSEWTSKLLSRGYAILSDMIKRLPEEDATLVGYYVGACQELIDQLKPPVGKVTQVEEGIEVKAEVVEGEQGVEETVEVMPVAKEGEIKQVLSPDEKFLRNYLLGVGRLTDLLNNLDADPNNQFLIAGISKNLEFLLASADMLELNNEYISIADILGDWERAIQEERGLVGNVIALFRERIGKLSEVELKDKRSKMVDVAFRREEDEEIGLVNIEEVPPLTGGEEGGDDLSFARSGEEDRLESAPAIEFIPQSRIMEEGIVEETEEAFEELEVDWLPTGKPPMTGETSVDEMDIFKVDRESVGLLDDSAQTIQRETSKIKEWVEIYQDLVSRLGDERARSTQLKTNISELLTSLSLRIEEESPGEEQATSSRLINRMERLQTISDELAVIARELAKIDELALGLLESIEEDMEGINKAVDGLSGQIRRLEG